MNKLTKSYISISILLILSISLIDAKSRLSNPERGLRYEAMARIPGLQFPWDANRILKPKTWCKDLESQFAATDGHVRVSQLYIYLTDFASTNTLSQEALDTIQSLFNGGREQGYKVVLRFAYTYDGVGGYVYPPMSRILGHLDQLKPIIQDNIDVITVWQSGIIGLWGEWHSYNNAYTQTDKDNLLKKIIEILPQNRQTMLRYINHKNSANLTTQQKSRIGYYNDFFTDDKHVNALNWGYLTPSVYAQVQVESPFVMVEGEMPYEGSTNNHHLNYVIDPIQSIKQFRDHRYNTFSLTHNYPVTFAGWKTMYLSKADMDQHNFPYDPEYFKNGSRTVYDYVADYLGYRLYVDFAASTVSDTGSQLNCNIKLINYGFSALHNPREVYLVLANCKNELVDLVKIATNPKSWHTGVVNSLMGTLTKPANLTRYKIGLWMPDFDGSKTKFDPRYAIQLCNSNTSWEEVIYDTNKIIGMNVLGVSTCMMLETDTCTVLCSDRGYIQTNSTHKWFQILDSQSQPITKYIAGNTFTFETWFYLDDMSNAQGMFFYINNGTQFGFAWNGLLMQNFAAGRTVDVWFNIATDPAFSDLTAGRWIHIALVVDGNNWKVYMDGTLRYNQNLGGGYINNTTNFLIGGDWWSPFLGKIAETRVWNTARTANEISDNMRKIVPIATTGLVGRVNFAEGSGERSTNFTSVGGNAWAEAGGATISWGLVSKTPSNLQTSAISSSGFSLNWDAGTESEYEVAVRPEGSTGSWTYFTFTSKACDVTGLNPGTTYDVKVMSTKPLETDYSATRQVSLLTTGVNTPNASGVKLITIDSQWQIESQKGQTVDVSVYCLSGSLVGTYSNQNKVNIDNSNFSKGVYLINVNTPEGRSVFKVVK